MKKLLIISFVLCASTPSHAFMYFWTKENTPACDKASERLAAAESSKAPLRKILKLDNDQMCACGIVRGDNGKPAGKCGKGKKS
jgi:hypothetical protein